MHPRNAGFTPGDHWMVCDVCGCDRRYSQMRRRWDNLWVCADDWEPRHPQDFLKAREDDSAPPVTRPADDTTFLSAGDVTADDL